MCLNGWGGKLHDQIIPFLGDFLPDVLCLQEVVHTPTVSSGWLTYRDGDHVLPQRANFFQDVQATLTDYTSIFCPAAQGELFDGDIAIDSQWGLATFIHPSLPVTEQIQSFVHKSFSAHDYGEHPRSRNAHAVRLFDYERNQPVCIVHTHGLRDLNGKGDTPERREQATRLLALTQSIAQPGDRVVVCGDLNVEPDSETLQLFGDAGFTELVTTRNFAGTRTASYTKPGRFADYLFVNTAVTVLGFDVLTEPEVSDHCPLVLEI